MFFHGFVASKTRKVSSEKQGGAEDRLPKMATKFAPRLRARAIWKSKSSKHRGFSALLEVEFRKIWTTLWRESDLEVKIVKNWRSWGVFGGSKCFSRGRRRDFDTLQDPRQAQEFVRVAKTWASVVQLKRVRNDAFRVAAAGVSCFVMSMFEDSALNPWKGCKFHVTQMYCYFAGIISRGSYKSSYASAQLFRGRRSTFQASTLKSLKHSVILRSSVW